MASPASFEDRVLEELRPGLEVFRQSFGGLDSFDKARAPAIRALLHPAFMAGLEAAPKFPDIEIGERRVRSDGGVLAPATALLARDRG